MQCCGYERIFSVPDLGLFRIKIRILILFRILTRILLRILDQDLDTVSDQDRDPVSDQDLDPGRIKIRILFRIMIGSCFGFCMKCGNQSPPQKKLLPGKLTLYFWNCDEIISFCRMWAKFFKPSSFLGFFCCCHSFLIGSYSDPKWFPPDLAKRFGYYRIGSTTLIKSNNFFAITVCNRNDVFLSREARTYFKKLLVKKFSYFCVFFSQALCSVLIKFA
jgi:hypothetical protein